MKRIAILMLLCTLGGGLRALAQTDSLPAASGTGAAAEETPAVVAEEPRTMTAVQLWEHANAAYVDGDYRTAAEIYRRILHGGRASVKLYYNLANACFKEGRLGEAVLYYHRALRLAPGNDDVRYNLGVAEAMTKDKIEEIPEFFLAAWLRTLRRTMGCTAWSVLSLVALAAMLGSILLYLLSQRLVWRKTGFYGTLVALLVVVVTMWFAVVERREILHGDEAIVMSASLAVKSSPDSSATDLFVLHEGTKVRVTDSLDAWCEVVIADGKKGWVEARKIEII